MSELNNILSHSDCLSQKQIKAYLSNTLDKEQTHIVESHMADCMFCSDAIDGLAMLPAEENEQHIGDIKSEIESLLFVEEETEKVPLVKKVIEQPKLTSTKSSKRISWRAAAGLFLLIFAGGLAVFSYVNNNTDWMKPNGGTDYAKGASETKEIKIEESKVSGRELDTYSIDAEDIAELDKVTAVEKNNIDLKKKQSAPKVKSPVSETERELATNEKTRNTSTVLSSPAPSKAKALEEKQAKPKTVISNSKDPIIAKTEINKEVIDRLARADDNAGYMNTATQPLYDGKLKNIKDINQAPAVTKSAAKKKISTSRYGKKRAESLEDIDIVQSKGLDKKDAYKQQTDYYSDGVYAFNQAKYKESVKLLKKALRDKNLKNREDALYYLALAYEKTNNLSKARKIYESLDKSKIYQSRSRSRLQQMPTK